MSYPLPETMTALRDQPVEAIKDVGGLYFRAIELVNVGDTVPQHVHDHEHVTIICSGAARLWVDGMWKGDFNAFDALLVQAGKEHVFQALQPNTRLACAHQLNGEPYRLAREA